MKGGVLASAGGFLVAIGALITGPRASPASTGR
jgi:hypothetical protein